ncbi:MAG TPA: TetR/AcrR family transcriptional regulator [Caulobacteraceae bacterium]|nr:TetR/AcrR family transcriptional regulator [Caulobacteraceae bacterium]
MAKDGYHHGDLANALVEAALKVVETEGVEAVSIRDLAAQIGVSRAAPYRHFEDRDALLAAVALKGFEALGDIYQSAADGPGDGRARLRESMRRYIAFATQHPRLHSLMFQAGVLAPSSKPPGLAGAAAERTYEVLWATLRGAYPHADEAWLKKKRTTMLSSVVGFLVLDEGGRFPAEWAAPLTRDDLIEAVLDAAVG